MFKNANFVVLSLWNNVRGHRMRPVVLSLWNNVQKDKTCSSYPTSSKFFISGRVVPVCFRNRSATQNGVRA